MDDPIVFSAPLPYYLKGGRYIVSSLGRQEASSSDPPKATDPEFTYYMDGFMKMHTVTFGADGTGATFSARMTNTKFYTESQSQGSVVSGSLFLQTDPKRPSDRVPLENFLGCLGPGAHCDNNPVVSFLLPGPEPRSLVYATDKSDLLVVDQDALNTSGVLQWEDLPPVAAPGSPGASHSLPLPGANGTAVVGLALPPYELDQAVVYRVEAGAPRTRVAAGRVRVRPMLYAHSFGLTATHALVLDHPVTFSVAELMGSGPLLDAMVLDNSSATKIHALDLASGEVATYDTGSPAFLFHVGNTYHGGGNGSTIVLDVETYDLSVNPLGTLSFENIFDPDFTIQVGSAYRRYTLDSATGAASFVELLAPDPAVGGFLGFPKTSPLWAGTQQCFTYLTWFRGDRTTSVVKYDHCREEVSAEWNAGPTGKLPTEMVFVGAPDSGPGGAGGEDHGVLLGVVFSTVNQTSEFTVVDAQTMTTLATGPLPFRVAWPLHGTFLESSP